jgi:hypothetical protein
METRLPQLLSYETVPEKAIKGSSISHKAACVAHLCYNTPFADAPYRLGPLQSNLKVMWLDADFVHGEHHPFAIIRLKYRSLGERPSSDTPNAY